MSKLIILISFAFLGTTFIQEKQFSSSTPTLNNDQPKELGKVNWLRNIDEATKLSKQSMKPIFLLFQEVPGCSTCQNYGQNVLSHPLIVEAIETYFVPLAIFNNKGGEDRKVLEYFNEPSWNNPVVRIIDHKKKNLIDRVNGNYSAQGITENIIHILKDQKKAIPKYLEVLHNELASNAQSTETAYLSMYCFWTGEKKLAGINGVTETQAGFMGGREVVKVKFDPTIIPFEDLVQTAQSQSCASHVYSNNFVQQQQAEKISDSVSEKKDFRMDKETKYYLYKSSYKYVPMTQLQAAKANRLIGLGQSPNQVLSPRQLELLKYIQKHPQKNWKNAINKDIITAWNEVKSKV